MNPLSIRARNLRSYPTLDFEIPEGVSAIIGPNGAGKSTLLGAIELALFADGARDLAPALGPFAERLDLALEFEHGGERYRVRRSYSAAGRGKATLDLDRYFDTSSGSAGAFTWESLTAESAAATQARINSLLGLSRATFRASAFMAQGDSAAFPEASPAERKALLGAILDPAELWPRLAERARAEARAAEAKLAAAQTKAADREPLAASVPERWRDTDRARIAQQGAEERAKEADRAWEAAKAALAGNEAAAERWQAAGAEVRAATQRAENARERIAETERAREDAAGAQAALATLAAKAARIPELERLAEDQRTGALVAENARKAKNDAEAALERAGADYIRQSRTLEALRKEFDSTVRQYEHLEGSESEERCDRCQQLLGAAARTAAILSLKTQVQALNERLIAGLRDASGAEEEVDRLRVVASAIEIPAISDESYTASLESARRAAHEQASLAARLEGYEAAAAKLPEHTAAYTAAERTVFDAQANEELARAAMADPAALRAAADRTELHAEERRTALREAEAALTRVEEALARAQEAAAEIQTLRAEVATLNAGLDLLRLAERACGRDGIPAWIAENACGAIEAEANHVLERLPLASGAVLRCEIRTQEPLKSDPTAVRERLDIIVSDGQSAREFLTYSGGERWRVAFALRWALARLLAGRRGAESRLLVIDEPDGLDAGGMDALAALLAEERAFSKVLLVSHSPLLASAFEQVVEIASDGEISRLVGVAAVEASVA